MRSSCNGCRVLRKGCGENCSIRPCLAWIESPESQANATMFLAKFYGRTGLINLIDAGPSHLRPAIFISLLQEACGRLVNPIYGSVGLYCSGRWQLCLSAVDAVLKGEAITKDTVTNAQSPPTKFYDIRHISKEENTAANGSSHRKRYKTRRSKRGPSSSMEPEEEEKCNEQASHDSSLSHQSEGESNGKEAANSPVELELKLGIEPVLSRADPFVVPVKKRKMGVFRTCQVDDDTCKEDD